MMFSYIICFGHSITTQFVSATVFFLIHFNSDSYLVCWSAAAFEKPKCLSGHLGLTCGTELVLITASHPQAGLCNLLKPFLLLTTNTMSCNVSV